MKRINLSPSDENLPYSQAILSNGFVFTSGQVPYDPETNQYLQEVGKATAKSLDNLSTLLDKAGSSLDKVIKITIFIKDMAIYDELNKAYSSYFSNHKPARSCVVVADLAKDILMEIEAIAEL